MKPAWLLRLKTRKEVEVEAEGISKESGFRACKAKSAASHFVMAHMQECKALDKEEEIIGWCGVGETREVTIAKGSHDIYMAKVSAGCDPK